jgi:octaprenyl-diphosphate synthase
MNRLALALFAAACEVGPILASRPKAEVAACRSYGSNLGIAFQLIDDALDYSAEQERLGKTVGDDFREGKITLPVLLAFARGDEAEREFWRRTIEDRDQSDADLTQAIALMEKHRAFADTVGRARDYGAKALAALDAFPDSAEKRALSAHSRSTIGPSSAKRPSTARTCSASRSARGASPSAR